MNSSEVCPSAVLPGKPLIYSRGQTLVVLLAASLILTLGITGCGSGGNSGNGGQNQRGYILSASSGTISIYPGGTATLIVTGQPLNGFSGTISVSLGGLPAGVTASPSSFSFTGSGTQQVQPSAVSSAAAGNSTVTLNGSGGTLWPSAHFQITVTGPASISLSLQPASLSLIPVVQQQVSTFACNYRRGDALKAASMKRFLTTCLVSTSQRFS